MKNTKYENIRHTIIDLCEQNKINYKDLLVYTIFTEYPNGIIDENHGDIEDIKKWLVEEYESLWDLQPTIEEDEEHAFAVQHARDIYDVLLNR